MQFCILLHKQSHAPVLWRSQLQLSLPDGLVFPRPGYGKPLKVSLYLLLIMKISLEILPFAVDNCQSSEQRITNTYAITLMCCFKQTCPTEEKIKGNMERVDSFFLFLQRGCGPIETDLHPMWPSYNDRCCSQAQKEANSVLRNHISFWRKNVKGFLYQNHFVLNISNILLCSLWITKLQSLYLFEVLRVKINI